MESDQDLVAALLKSMPPPDVRGDFVARVSARIDRTAGWLGLADFRAWTLGLVPAAAALVLVAVFWSAPSGSTTASMSASATAAPAAAASTFSPASSSDWQKDVSGEAMIEAALTPRGDRNVR